MVYFLQHGDHGPVKIGYVQSGRSINDRIRTLQVGNPEELKLLTVLPTGGKGTKKWLSDVFKDDNVRGEWFRPTKPLLKLIEKCDASPSKHSKFIEMELAAQRRARTPKKAAIRPSKKKVKDRIQREIEDGTLVVKKVEL